MKDGLGGIAGKGLESALGIGKLEAHDGADDGVEAAAKELAIERLAVGLAAVFEPSRADGDVGAGGDGGKEALGFLDGRRKIGVGEHDHFAECLKHAGAHAVSLAAIAGIFDQADFRVVCGEIADHLGRRVRGAVVDDDDFSGPAALRMQATTDRSVAGMRALSL